MEIISDSNHYIIEFVVSVVLGFIFGRRIELIVIAFAIVVLASVAIVMLHDETTNPNNYNITNSTGVSNLTKNITDYTTLGVNIILALAFGGAGTSLGTGIRRRFWP